ncbi:hypothetical protein PHYBLDRAFT_58879 [Phycomyces blakesleeanus NRRL 1555(-)]|uniref:Uncharacterized protein n=1 Tax=Phycomyces blakesleeanus (strain ATCC 8743b / DSM 1359 / FGSC 10004 / NBRC 33097 / NRRL 1555) TaxID=763407 RepID=A0A162YCV4_PHYB8|nr:hypothetical protein PHYBLDRAFT_58879 [Phycomyces blakesleeanus NRRL 1555(-)]OAD79835.1 hypothetical protein PHYBLDRAFT_58879 [Phycomyces blakesleeanus NRRL 1555(-)]|eukprot:XP_018297875.1 hypothetical protein PHYBLDRAFT_58879 [Phycomyces blakesleeanus NRRL 1555(-)]
MKHAGPLLATRQKESVKLRTAKESVEQAPCEHDEVYVKSSKFSAGTLIKKKAINYHDKHIRGLMLDDRKYGCMALLIRKFLLSKKSYVYIVYVQIPYLFNMSLLRSKTLLNISIFSSYVDGSFILVKASEILSDQTGMPPQTY